MVDFNQLVEGGVEVDPTDPIALFRSLDRQQSHVELRSVQEDLLKTWQPRRGERDVVVKLPTGAGKTTVGLLMLLSHMSETKRPALYLCPNNQLVDQVVSEGHRCGIRCTPFGAGDRYIPAEVQGAESILVTSVQKLFNARTTFSRNDVSFRPHAVLLDDAHAAMEIVRESFTVRASASSEVYKRLLTLFDGALRDQSPGLMPSLRDGDPSATSEVPYWRMLPQIDDLADVLAHHSEEDELKFKWGLVRDYLRGLRCVFSGAQVEMVPEVLPTSAVPAYHNAQRRIFMSATLSDESGLVRDLDCAPAAAKNPLELSTALGLGERMLIVPQLMGSGSNRMTRKDLEDICTSVSQRHAVVVIAPSDKQALEWKQTGAKVLVGASQDAINRAIGDLKAARERFVVFSNRYDGIDLPDDACRLLVLDGTPKAPSLLDAVEGMRGNDTSARQRTLIHRVEQGLGRAVRTPSDYAAVIIWGDDLVSLLSDRSKYECMGPETRVQIELGLTIAKNAKVEANPKKSVEGLIGQSLQRDPGWKKFYAQKMKAVQVASNQKTRAARVDAAVLEREAWQSHMANRGNEGAQNIQTYINDTSPADQERAWLLQRAAWYMYAFDVDRALAMQKSAHDFDPMMLRPPKGVIYVKQIDKMLSQAAGLLTWYRNFSLHLGAVARIEHLKSMLVFSPDASSENFEEGLKVLGEVLGLESSRPERLFGCGPDALWLHGQYVIPIEAKSRSKADATFISKDNAGQLTQSASWASETYAERARLIPIIAHPTAVVGPNAFPPANTRVLTPVRLGALLDALSNTMAALSERPAERWDVGSIDKILQARHLTLPGLIDTFTDRGT